MTQYARVEGHPNLIRDLNTNAIINTDESEFNNYDRLKRKKEEEKEKINNIEKEVSELKSSIEEIKHLLKTIANGS